MKVKTIKDKSKVPAWKNKWVSGADSNNDYSGDLRTLSLNRINRNEFPKNKSLFNTIK
ncbi:hypothetical protein LCGC14_1752000 [marine sediment metagenome]|uniref:Uncharacterized protein n=1 Tax=marine sediment metagenome TaxID=412755 RepID=A0A0F9HQY4_9ZZZZ